MELRELLQQAEGKNPNAMFELAEAYYLGDRGVSADDAKAFSLYKELEALTPDDGMVLYRLGKCYEIGVGVDKDTNLALDYYQKAVEKGSGIACKTLGEFYKSGKYVQQDITKCLEYLNKGAAMKTPGSDEAAIMLGDMYHHGDEGVEKNDAKACDLYRIAAELGNSNAYYRLGMQTFNGWGVESDKAQGMEYWKKGAELNHWGCMYIIGVSYIEGKDLPKDIEKGLYWLEHSADRGLADARCYLGKVYLRGLYGVPKNEEKGVRHLKAAANSDQEESAKSEAMIVLADYLREQNTPNGFEEAFSWYQKASERGEADAFTQLGDQLYFGKGVKEDKAKAIEYWEKGAALGSTSCMYYVGIYSLDGENYTKNTERGLHWLERAADSGLLAAQFRLGYIFLTGESGVEQNREKSIKLLSMAAESGRGEVAGKANFILGDAFLTGNYGISQNEDKGIGLLKLAAESGHKETEIRATVALGDYYWKKQTAKSIEEAAKWYEICADKGVPYAARMAVSANLISAIGGSAPSIRHSNPFGYEFNRDEWAKVATLAQKEIDLLQRGPFEGRDEQLEAARADLVRAKYEQAVCSYEMKEYHEAMDLLQGVLFRDSELLSALAHFWSEKGGSDEAFINTLREVVSAFLRLNSGEELKSEEEEIRATAASMIAEGYYTGIPGVLPQDMRQAEETLRKTIASLTDADWVQMLNDKLTQYGFNRGAVQPAIKAPVPKEPEKPEVMPKSQPRQLPKADPNDKFGWARSEKEKKSQVTTDNQVQKQDTTGKSHQNGNGNSGTKTLLYVLIGLMSAVVILLFVLVLKNHQKRPSDETLSAPKQTEMENTEMGQENTNGMSSETNTDSELRAEAITIDRQDFSIVDDAGETVVNLYYDLVRLPDETEPYQAINEILTDDYNGYYYNLNTDEMRDYYEKAKAAKAENDDSGYEWWQYEDTITASVETCENGVLSILLAQNWYMGGVANHNCYGATFNTRTGEQITLEDIGNLLEPDLAGYTFLEYLKMCIYEEMSDRDIIEMNTEDALNELQLEDLQFYLESGELYIYINTYQLASGAAGSFAVPTRITINI